MGNVEDPTFFGKIDSQMAVRFSLLRTARALVTTFSFFSAYDIFCVRG
jgi:hypothetical protein